jgi:RHS repeat-associated protein
MIKDGVRYRILSDHLGSPRLVISEDGSTILARMDYDEYGRLVGGSANGVLPFGFAGGLYDEVTGLVRFGARDYDPETGRWLAGDPLRTTGSVLNAYVYTYGEPVNFVDSDGRNPLAAGWVAAAGADSQSSVSLTTQAANLRRLCLRRI